MHFEVNNAYVCSGVLLAVVLAVVFMQMPSMKGGRNVKAHVREPFNVKLHAVSLSANIRYTNNAVQEPLSEDKAPGTSPKKQIVHRVNSSAIQVSNSNNGMLKRQPGCPSNQIAKYSVGHFVNFQCSNEGWHPCKITAMSDYDKCHLHRYHLQCDYFTQNGCEECSTYCRMAGGKNVLLGVPESYMMPTSPKYVPGTPVKFRCQQKKYSKETGQYSDSSEVRCHEGIIRDSTFYKGYTKYNLVFTHGCQSCKRCARWHTPGGYDAAKGYYTVPVTRYEANYVSEEDVFDDGEDCGHPSSTGCPTDGVPGIPPC